MEALSFASKLSTCWEFICESLFLTARPGMPVCEKLSPASTPWIFFKKRKSIFQKGSYRNMLLIYNTSHNNRHQNQGEKFVSPLAWCAHTHTQNTTLQTPLSNQCEDFIGMCHFGCTTAVLHTYTHTYTHHQSRASHIQICTCSASALSLMIGLVSDVYCASLALSLSACLIQVRLVVSR